MIFCFLFLMFFHEAKVSTYQFLRDIFCETKLLEKGIVTFFEQFIGFLCGLEI